MKKLLIISLMLSLLAFTILSANEAIAGTYSTSFTLTENPISEGGNWTNGNVNGLYWSDVRTASGLAYGTETGSINYDDSTALLKGSWGPDQTVIATVHTVNQQGGGIFEEVEIRLRSSISAYTNNGYEINFSLRPSGAYAQIVRWNGPLGNFTLLASLGIANIHDGDVVKATIIGNTIRGYVNNVQVVQATDSTYSMGNPGIGFYLIGGPSSLNSDFGFTSFAASDGLDTRRPSPPTNLSILPQ
jgi:hypothetical protein